MSERTELTLVVLVVLILSVLWGIYYVSPKSDTLLAASECVHSQGYPLDNSPQSQAAWDVCLGEAEAKHGSKLLKTVGY